MAPGVKCADLKNVMPLKKLQVQNIKMCRFKKNIMSLKKVQVQNI